MLSKKKALIELTNFIDKVKTSITNKEVLDYLVSNLVLSTKRGTVINFKGKNSIILTNGITGEAFYLEVIPTLDNFSKIYTRYSKNDGNYDERMTATFEDNVVVFHKYSSNIIKDKCEGYIDAINDRFSDEVFENNELRYRKRIRTELSYPTYSNAITNSTFEEISLDENGYGVFKEASISSENGESHRFGAFNLIDNGHRLPDDLDDLKGIQIIDEEEYDKEIVERNQKYMKELKNGVI